jgi:hypothetical protein
MSRVGLVGQVVVRCESQEFSSRRRKMKRRVL